MLLARARESPTPPRQTIAVLLPLEVQAPEAPWLGPVLNDLVGQSLVGDPALALAYGPQLDQALKDMGTGRADPGEGLGARFNARWVLQLQAFRGPGSLGVRLGVRDRRSGRPTVWEQVEGRPEEPGPFQRRLHDRLRAAVGLPARPLPPRLVCGDPEAWAAFGLALAALDRADLPRIDAALADLQRCLARVPDFLPARIHLARTVGQRYFQVGWARPTDPRREELRAYEAAVASAEALDPGHLLVRLEKATLCGLRQELGQAAALAEGVLQADPFQLDAELVLADCYMARPDAESQVRAKMRLERALALGDDRYYPRFRLTVVHMQNGNLDRAQQLADQLIAQWPEHFMGYVLASNALLWQSRYEEARQRIEAGLRRFPDAPLLHRNLGYAAFCSGDRALLAQELAFARRVWAADRSTAILMEGLRPASRRDLVGVRAQYGAFLRRVQERPDSVEPTAASVDLYFMARILAQLGDPTKGRPYLEAADRLVPNRSRPAKSDPAFR